eukprot:g29698.t1
MVIQQRRREEYLLQELHEVNFSKDPSRLWGQVKPTKYGGIERVDGVGTLWLSGDYWNVDSNIMKWGKHEIRHLHGIHFCSKFQAWGFDLGLRDRQGNNTGLWKPVGRNEMFRSERSYTRNIERILQNTRTLRGSASVPGSVMAQTLKPEDIGGEAGELSTPDDATMLRAGLSSCYGWDRYDHTCRREAAKLSCSIHCPAEKVHAEGYPFKELDLNPASVYTKKFRMTGEASLRARLSKSATV